MAYGKDPRVLEGVSSFRNEARNFENERARSPAGGTGGTRPTWIDSFKPQMDDEDRIRVIPGHYEVEVAVGTSAQDVKVEKRFQTFFPWHQHYHAIKEKYVTCSAGPLGGFKGKSDPCRACDQFWADKMANRGTKKQGPISRREMYSFTVLHYAPYAYIEQTDQNGAIRMNENTNEPYMNWVRVFPHELAKFAGREMRDAMVLHWDMGTAHYTTLREYDESIGKSCRCCGGRNTIQMEAWLCTNPACGEALIERGTTYSPKEVKELTQGEVRCAHCQQVVWLKEVISCTQCGSGQRADIFDVDMSVERVPDGKGNKGTNLLITEWSEPRPIDARYTEIAKPMDLKKIFTPTPIAKQEELFGPYTPVNTGNTRQPVTVGSRPYGGK